MKNLLPPSTPSPWRLISSEVKYKNPWISVREDQVITPAGTPGIYGVVESKVATGVVAITEKDEVILVGQYRYPINIYSWEIVEGGAEHGEDPQLAAVRELKEEAGIVAKNIKQIGQPVFLSNCFSSEKALFYLATDLNYFSSQPEAVESLQIAKIPFNLVMQMVHSGEITDSMSIIALHRVDAYRRGIISI